MKNRRVANNLILFVALLLFASGVYVILNSNLNLKVPDSVNQDNLAQVYTGDFPAGIKIPAIGVNAPIIPVGITKLGSMDVPSKPMDTGWYRLGPKPGEVGSAVIAGHRGFRSGPAVFDNLHNIKTGDKVYITDEKGGEQTFIVRETRTYGAWENVPAVWNKNDSAHLNLITCFGKWNKLTGTSDERLVVFTDLQT
jgi:sortase A